jgi:hypothetical protein
MNNSRISLEERKNFITKLIIKHCDENLTKYTAIMESEFQDTAKPVKNYDWVNDFTVGEEVIVRHFKSKKPRTVTRDRKGIIRKIGKTIQVELYNYFQIIDVNAIKNQTYGKHRLIWSDTFDEKITVYCRNALYKRGEYNHIDALFEEGEKSCDYGW